jgi:hypothetical protein
LVELMQFDLAVPDHTTPARRRRTVDVCEYRWPRRGPIDLVIDSTGLKFFGVRMGESKARRTRRS